MTPLSSTPALPKPARLPSPATARLRFAWLGLIGLIASVSAASLATAGGTETAPSRRVELRRSPVVTAKSPPPSSLRPQTRYTVRKQIESIEPISWLERYGKVRIRELGH